MTVYVNDTFALIAARVNAAGVAAGLAPLSVGAIGTAAGQVPVLARTLMVIVVASGALVPAACVSGR